MESEDLKRLRRLSLTLGLLVLTWALAGVVVSLPLELRPLGLPVIISRPDLLPIGLALGASYSALRYFYYAHMLGVSPYRRRRDLLDRLWAEGQKKPGLSATYWGPEEFEASPLFATGKEADQFARSFEDAFPKFFGGRYSTRVESFPGVDNEGEEYTSYRLHVRIPRRSRQAALLGDLDYSSPAWFPVLAVLVWLLSRP